MSSLPSVPTMEQIAAGYAAITKSDAGARWRWARNILAVRSAEKSDKDRAALDKQLGITCAAAVNRAKAYSPQWIRAYVNAAKQFASEPVKPEDCERFVALCNNQSAKKQSAGESTKDDAIRMLKSAAKMALKRGATEDEIAAAVESIINGASSAEAA